MIRRLSFFLAAALAGAATISPPLTAQEADIPADGDAPTVTVGATGTATASPDQAVLTIAVETVGATAEEALAQNATRADAVIGALTGLGIPREDIRTASFGLTPEYARPERGAEQQEPRIVGYRAFNMLRVEVDDAGEVGAVIDAAAGAGSNRIGGPSFGIADPEPLRMRALDAAVAKARAEAEALAAALGMSLGDPIRVETSYEGGEPPMPMGRTMALEADVGTPIEPGTSTVSASVRITWRLTSR